MSVPENRKARPLTVKLPHFSIRGLGKIERAAWANAHITPQKIPAVGRLSVPGFPPVTKR
jgi:hypothetical protein